jgi:hypothetical protein
MKGQRWPELKVLACKRMPEECTSPPHIPLQNLDSYHYAKEKQNSSGHVRESGPSFFISSCTITSHVLLGIFLNIKCADPSLISNSARYTKLF